MLDAIPKAAFRSTTVSIKVMTLYQLKVDESTETLMKVAGLGGSPAVLSLTAFDDRPYLDPLISLFSALPCRVFLVRLLWSLNLRCGLSLCPSVRLSVRPCVQSSIHHYPSASSLVDASVHLPSISPSSIPLTSLVLRQISPANWKRATPQVHKLYLSPGGVRPDPLVISAADAVCWMWTDQEQYSVQEIPANDQTGSSKTQGPAPADSRCALTLPTPPMPTLLSPQQSRSKPPLQARA